MKRKVNPVIWVVLLVLILTTCKKNSAIIDPASNQGKPINERAQDSIEYSVRIINN